MLSTELMSCYHVKCTMHYTCSYYAVHCKDNKDNLVWGRLDGWLNLVGWISGSIVVPLQGTW